MIDSADLQKVFFILSPKLQPENSLALFRPLGVLGRVLPVLCEAACCAAARHTLQARIMHLLLFTRRMFAELRGGQWLREWTAEPHGLVSAPALVLSRSRCPTGSTAAPTLEGDTEGELNGPLTAPVAAQGW